MDFELKKSLGACQEILSDLPKMLQNSISELEEDLKFVTSKLSCDKSEILKQLMSQEEYLEKLCKEKQNLKAQLSKAENPEVLQETETNLQQEPEDLSEDLKYYKGMLNYLKSKVSLYYLCTKIRWDLDSSGIQGKIQDKPFRIEGEVSFETVNKLWELLDYIGLCNLVRPFLNFLQEFLALIEVETGFLIASSAREKGGFFIFGKDGVFITPIVEALGICCSWIFLSSSFILHLSCLSLGEMTLEFLSTSLETSSKKFKLE